MLISIVLPHVDCVVANVSSINRSTLRWTCWLLTVCSPCVACLFGVRLSVSLLKTTLPLHPGCWLFALWRISAVLCSLLPSIRSYTNFKLISSPSVHILSSASPSLESRKTGWGSVAAAALMTVTNVSQFCGKHFIDINCIQPRQSPQKFYAMLDTSQRQATAATAVSSCPQ